MQPLASEPAIKSLSRGRAGFRLGTSDHWRSYFRSIKTFSLEVVFSDDPVLDLAEIALIAYFAIEKGS
jgi:hypothetical protein